MSEVTYATISVSGPDAFDFLQGQLTVDLNEQVHGEDVLSAWCNPKGRVICLVTVAVIDNGYALTLPAELADDVAKRLTVFRFRAKVDFQVQPAPERDPDADAADKLLRQRLHDGIPEIGREQSEKFTPHMLNLDLLGAVSLDKGCYTGQEIIARTHYRGATKRRCLRFESAEPVAPGDKVNAGERAVGEVVNAIGNDLLAIVPLDKAESGLTVNGVSLTLVPLPYI